MAGAAEVSVLVTAYNRERYVGQAIESILAQSFEDFEVIVVDDQSTDRTVEIAKSYESDPRVHVVVNERNLGDYPNRNRAATLASGRFLKYHDSDDVMYSHCLSTMVTALRAEPGAAFALSSPKHWEGGPCPILSTPLMSYQREFLGYGMFSLGPAGALFRTDALRDLGGFPEAGLRSDLVFWLKACARVNVLLVPGDLFWYRVHPGQEFQKPTAASEYTAVVQELWSALTSPECPLSGEELEQAKRNLTYHVAKRVLFDIVAGRWRYAALRLRKCGIPFSVWPRYLRRAKRSRLAGTPLDKDGEYVVPPHMLKVGF
jgi:hypothetical protein